MHVHFQIKSNYSQTFMIDEIYGNMISGHYFSSNN